ncbi:MAG TPA: lipopolysaccharide assembly protein LapA domain-containing protein [Pseudonocardiaceae bacterium]
MVDHEHPADAPDTDPIPVPAAPTPVEQQQKQVRRTRISGLWAGVTVAAVVLLVLLVFIIQNGQSVTISFFAGHLVLPLGVALLLAAICGVLVLAIPGYGRIIQLRRAIRRSGNTRPAR